MRGHALPNTLFVQWVREQRQVAVNVGIDEPGAYDLPVSVDALLRAGVAEAADAGDAVARDADIGLEPRQPGAIDHAAIANEEIEHRTLGELPA
ncbi:MAG: hypothetical protein U0792_13955 [Gemmataceae bacterium]